MVPVLRKRNEDGSEDEVSEEEFYRHTRYRWLCDEPRNLAVRYRKFNIPALVDAAIAVAGDGATSCVKVLKCVEGQYNKAFILTMDNGVEIVAKIPNPNAGPAFYTTASEVATRQFARTFLNLPIPRIYSYSLNPFNPVGAEYIMEEKARGRPLGSLWHQWKKESQLDLVAELVDFELMMTSISFRTHGCIYYKKDLKEKGVPPYDLEAKLVSSAGSVKSLDPALTEDFALGPLTEARLWEGERASMDLDRGPWTTPLSYMAAMGINEIRWTKQFARPRIDPYRSLETPVSPDEYISLLERYLQLVPYLSPGSFRTSLSHPDLHLDNIFVDPDTKKITCIIDWQSASVSEPFLQQHVPRMLLQVSSNSAGERSDVSSEKWKAQGSSNATTSLLSGYQNLTRLRNEQRWAAMNLSNRSLLKEPVSLLCGSWSRSDVFSFRHALIHVAARWKDLAPANISCPIRFTEDELQLHEDELELVEGLGEVLLQLQRDGLIPLGGMVLRNDYEQALNVSNAVQEMFVEMAGSEPQKALHKRVWPYQEHES